MPQDQDDIKGADAMKQAPTPGPLDNESVKLLVKGDLLWSSDTGRIGRFSDISATKPFCLHIWWSEDTYSPTHPLDGLSFVGRPDADGWMLWSGGENPVPGQKVDYRWMGPSFPAQKDDPNVQEGGSQLSDKMDWRDIIAFRLAPTAPVEASGSERERLALVIDPRIAGMDFCNYTPDSWMGQALAAADRVLALRPRPSGETREVAKDIASRDEASKVLGWFSGLARKEGNHVQADWLDSYIASLSTTPARAEAQDEGAAKRAAIMREVKAYGKSGDVGSALWVNALTSRIMVVTQ